jgi:uncharacterized membrane protein YjgN (DUF898 family)
MALVKIAHMAGAGSPALLLDNEKLNAIIGLLFFAVVFMTSSIATPWIASRTARYFVTRLGMEGGVDFAAIEQSRAALDKMGEGLAEGFDIDAF